MQDAFVQTVRETIDIIDLVSEQTRLVKKGRHHEGLCPFHKEKSPSFSVDAERGLYHCFGCGAGGDGFRFHMQITGDDFRQALHALARRYGIPIPERGGESVEDSLDPVLEAAETFFRDQLSRQAGPLDYLRRRDISSELIEAFGIGFAPDDWRSLFDALRPRFAEDKLERCGLVARSERAGRYYDRFRNRLMFPIRSASGRLVGFGGRTLGDDRAKYINTAETASFRKGSLLYNLDRARSVVRSLSQAVLVEGYFDVLAMVASGVENAVASMGTALTERQVKMLSQYSDEVIVAYDGDQAGEAASKKALALLLRAGSTVRRARFPAGQDPDSVRQEVGPEAVRLLVEEAPDAVDLEIERIPEEVIREPRLRSRWAAELRELLESIPDSVLRYGYAERTAAALRLPVEVLWPPRGTVSRPATAGDAPVVGETMVPGMEERVLQLLLSAGGSLPDLPPTEVFRRPACREIFSASQAVLAEREKSDDPSTAGPLVEAVREFLPASGEGVVLLSRLLLEEPAPAREGELEESLIRLRKRARTEQVRSEPHEDIDRVVALYQERLGLSARREKDHEVDT